jgi:hypothetical protein
VTRGAIMGPSLSGKTTLGIDISRNYWRQDSMRSLVFSPIDPAKWGNQAWVCKDEVRYWKAVETTNDCLCIVDDASVTIRREKDLLGMFTTLRHRRHKLLVIGHTASDLLPAMRKQIDTIFLFWQDQKEAETWERLFPRSNLSFAFHLQQFEFLRCVRFGETQRNKLTI